MMFDYLIESNAQFLIFKLSRNSSVFKISGYIHFSGTGVADYPVVGVAYVHVDTLSLVYSHLKDVLSIATGCSMNIFFYSL